jgi:hypothetical protein
MDDTAPPYATPAIGEAIRVYDATSWQRTVPGVYLGYEHISDDFFMHRVRSDRGLVSMLASHEVFRRHDTAGGAEWVPLTKRPRIR